MSSVEILFINILLLFVYVFIGGVILSILDNENLDLATWCENHLWGGGDTALLVWPLVVIVALWKKLI